MSWPDGENAGCVSDLVEGSSLVLPAGEETVGNNTIVDDEQEIPAYKGTAFRIEKGDMVWSVPGCVNGNETGQYIIPLSKK